MKIGVIGSGSIGKNAAKHFALAGQDVYLSNSRGPESLKSLEKELGPKIQPSTVADTVSRTEVILLAVPWSGREQLFSEIGPSAFAGKIVIDAMNPYSNYPEVEDLGGKASSEVVAAALPGARVVKAFNTIYFASLAENARPSQPEKERIALPIAADDPSAAEIVAKLIRDIGFAPVKTGTLAQSMVQEPFQPFYNRDLTPGELEKLRPDE
jgi:8-hydroxy-5-deazaflavin:NADPH oxidoreductase